jgi:uncharacterized membrane protein YbhN (UPF0104 family)
MPSIAKWHSTALQLVFAALLLGLLVHFVGWRDLLTGLSAARWPWLVAMYGVVLVTFSVMAASLHLLLTKTGVDVSLRRVLLANALANLYALVLPGDLMAGVSKWVVLSAATGQRAKVLSAIVLNKLAGGLPPLLFGMLALAFDSPIPGLPVGTAVVVAAAVTVAGLFLVLDPRAGPFVEGRLRTASQLLPNAVRPAVEKFLEALAAFRAFGVRDHLQVLGLALLAFWLGIFSFFCATRALGLDVPIATLVWISLALFISRLLPITFNNLGVREGLLVLALGTNQVEPALALGVGLLMFSNTIWIGFLGAACQISIALGWVKLTDEGASGLERRRFDLGNPR